MKTSSVTSMNYFELFDLPVSFLVDKKGLAKQFFSLQKRFHPDYFTGASPEEQETALEQSSFVNKAFRVLQDPDATMQYVLQLKGLLADDEKFSLPQDFLMEMMELNEAIMDARLEGTGTESIEARIAALKQEMYEPVKAIVEHYQEGVTSEEALLQVKLYYFKKKYLNRILEGLQ